MFFPVIRVVPDPKYSAEVVVLVTTLGAKRAEFNAGKRARDLLEIKRVHHKIIDFNRDARQAGSGEAENQAIKKLMDDGKLQTGDNDDLILPQVFIDGLYIGDAVELQGLEDDGFLERMLVRRACVNCNDQTRKPSSSQCQQCWAKFEEILPGLMTIDDELAEDYDDEYDEEFEGNDRPRRKSKSGADPHARAEVCDWTEAVEPPVANGGFEQPAVSSTALDETYRIGGDAEEAYADADADAAAGGDEFADEFAEEVAPPIGFRQGDQVLYWSETKARWLDATITAIREKEGNLVYDLNCKKGAPADKLRLHSEFNGLPPPPA